MSEPKKNTAFIFITQLVSVASAPDFQANPTLAAGDVTVSIDGGNPANITTLPTAVNSGKNIKVSLSAAEMNGDYIAVLFSDAAGAEWHDTAVNINPVTYTSNDLYTAVTSNVATTITVDNSNADFKVWAANDFTIEADIKDTDGTTALDVSGFTAFTWELANRVSDSTALISKTLAAGDISVGDGDGTNDRVSIVVADTDTTTLAGVYYHQLNGTDAGGNIKTLFAGNATILRSLI